MARTKRSASAGRQLSVSPERARISQGGRVVIPASMRKALDLAEGDMVTLEIQGDALTLTPPLANLRRAREILLAHGDLGRGRSLSDELIAERREAAKRGD